MHPLFIYFVSCPFGLNDFLSFYFFNILSFLIIILVMKHKALGVLNAKCCFVFRLFLNSECLVYVAQCQTFFFLSIPTFSFFSFNQIVPLSTACRLIFDAFHLLSALCVCLFFFSMYSFNLIIVLMTHADEYFYDETIAYIFFAFYVLPLFFTVCYDSAIILKIFTVMHAIFVKTIFSIITALASVCFLLTCFCLRSG